jgi:pre-mRNA-processing factor 40
LVLQSFIPASTTTATEDENTPGTEAYLNKEEARKEFNRLLRKTDIEPNSQWNDILPQIIKNPAFRGVKDPVERKQLFESYLQTIRSEVEETEKARRTRVRERFIQMCKRHPDIKHYTRYRTAKPILQDETDWKAPRDEDERRELFELFRAEALKEYEDKEEEQRSKAMKVFREVLESLQLEPYARWRPTRDLFERKIREEGKQEELAALNEIDFLTVFEDYVKELEKDFNNIRQTEKEQKFRQERKSRDAFNVLLLKALINGRNYYRSWFAKEL